MEDSVEEQRHVAEGHQYLVHIEGKLSHNSFRVNGSSLNARALKNTRHWPPHVV